MERRREPARQRVVVGAGFLANALVHALVGGRTHPLRVVHAVFGALYLVPIVAAAVWSGARAGFALAIAAAYVVHARCMAR